jgi:energy-coupling factor transport system ATP-binding protein
LRLKKGEILAIVGANGAGKTTLIKHFNGLLKPFAGTVEVLGIDTRKAKVSELATKVGIAFQNPEEQLFHQLGPGRNPGGAKVPEEDG